MARGPDFLIIGAMKAGTSSLWWDLRANPQVYLPVDKELNSLRTDGVLSEAGRGEYVANFADARDDQIVGEASTAYTKLPTYPGVPRRAMQVVGPELKLIYIIRDPIARIVSHHFHIHTTGDAGPDIDRVIRDDPTLIAYSSYAMQLEPWVEAYGRERVLVVPFERFIADRCGWAERVAAFLGITPRPDLVEADRVLNRSDKKPLHKGLWTRLNRSAVYRRVMRPMFPARLRLFLYDLLLPKAPPRPAPPRPDTVELILDRLRDDQARLWSMLGEGQPWWDLEQIRRKHVEAWEHWRQDSGLSEGRPAAVG